MECMKQCAFFWEESPEFLSKVCEPRNVHRSGGRETRVILLLRKRKEMKSWVSVTDWVLQEADSELRVPNDY